MSAYSPPTESLQEFNIDVFNQPDDTISQGEGGLLYLSKVDSDTSTAPSTTFNGAVIFNTCPQSNVEPSADKNLTTKYYVDFNYLTKTLASTTYQTIAGMTAYLTVAVASATYQTIAGMSNYLDITNNLTQAINGLKTFSNNLTVGASASLTVLGDQLISNQIVARTLNGTKNLWSTITSGDIHFGGLGSTLQIYPSTTFSVIPNCSVGASSANQLVNYTTLTGQSYTTLPIIQANANAWTNTNTFNSFLPTSTQPPTNPTDLTTKTYVDTFLTQANAVLTYLTIATASATYLTSALASTTYLTIANASTTYLTIANALSTYARVGSANTFTAINQFNQPIKIQYAAAQFTDLDQTAQTFSILNKSTGGNVRIKCRTSPGLVDTDVAVFNTTGINLGTNAGSNSIIGNATSFDHQVSITGPLTAGNSSLINTISGLTTFNQSLSVSGTASVTGLLTATGGLKANAITPLVASGQNDIYSSLPVGATIVFGTASRTLNIYGTVNLVNSCQFSNALQTNDITHIGTQSNTAKNIYTGLTTGGSVTIGSNTANTTINIRGGAINVGVSTSGTTTILGNAINMGAPSKTLTINSPTTFNEDITAQDITCKSALYFTDIDLFVKQNIIYHYGGVLIFTTPSSATNYNNGYEFMSNGNTMILINETDTEINNSLNVKGGLRYRYDKIVDEIQTLTGTSHTLIFPLQQTTIFTNTGNISVTLPQITTDTQLGLRFTFVNLGSITTTTTFVRQGTNLIIPVGQMSQFTSSAIINNTKTICNLVIVKLGGIYIWTEYTF